MVTTNKTYLGRTDLPYKGNASYYERCAKLSSNLYSPEYISLFQFKLSIAEMHWMLCHLPMSCADAAQGICSVLCHNIQKYPEKVKKF